MATVARVPEGFDPNTAQNHQDVSIERQFAVKAVLHAQTYWNILEKVKGTELRLTKLDNEIYEHFQKDFPDVDVSKVIDEEAMKSKAGKDRWRMFMQAYEKKVEDYNFGTLMRNDPKAEYTETTTIFVQRMQFYAIEIARNRLGLNDWIKETVDKEEAKKAKEAEKKDASKVDKAEKAENLEITEEAPAAPAVPTESEKKTDGAPES
ncbi:polysaccharide biosynthesis-domain-containing protein [Kalaharituber pfeilii]|nr:polysaccharide biosynthesis-domain-containing protein [Kalaharituber pfeilii]